MPRRSAPARARAPGRDRVEPAATSASATERRSRPRWASDVLVEPDRPDLGRARPATRRSAGLGEPAQRRPGRAARRSRGGPPEGRRQQRLARAQPQRRLGVGDGRARRRRAGRRPSTRSGGRGSRRAGSACRRTSGRRYLLRLRRQRPLLRQRGPGRLAVESPAPPGVALRLAGARGGHPLPHHRRRLGQRPRVPFVVGRSGSRWRVMSIRSVIGPRTRRR